MNGLNKLVGHPIPWFAIVSIVLLIGSVGTVVILTGSQHPGSSTQAGSFEYKITTEALSSGEDIVISIDNITLYIPGSVITLPGSISLFLRKPILFYAADELPWYRPFVVNVEYWNEDGEPYPQVEFSSPVEICFKLSSRQWEDYTNHSDDYQVQYLVVEEVPPRWEALPSVSYSERSELCGQTEYFSLFALATKFQGSIPVTGITPNPPPVNPPPVSKTLDPTPTPAPESLITILSNFLNLNSNDGPSGVYEP